MYYIEENEPMYLCKEDDSENIKLKKLEDEALKMGRKIFNPYDSIGSKRTRKTLCIMPFKYKGYRFWMKPLILHQELRRKGVDWDFHGEVYDVFNWDTVRIEKWNILKR